MRSPSAVVLTSFGVDMRLRYLFYLVVLSVFALTSRAQSQAVGQPPSTLQAAVQAAWERSPQGRTLEARRGEVEVAQEAAATWIAGAPSIGLSQRNGNGGDRGGARETDVSLSAPLWLPAHKASRQGLANRSVIDLEAQITQARLALAGEVREQVWAVAMAEEALVAAQDHQHHLEALAQEVLQRVRAGDLSRADSLLAQQEVLAAHAQVAQARSRLAQATSRYRVLTGQADIPASTRESLPASPPDAHPRIVAARSALERSRASLNLVNAIRSDPPTVGVLARREQDRPGAGSANSIGVSVQIPIGTRARNRPLEAAANTQMTAASVELSQAEAQVRNELALQREQLQTALQALAAATARAALTREHTDLLQKAFKLGERGLAELLRSEALSHEAAVSARQQKLAVDLAHARINQASGILP
jgi:cobalt-zinc-cadmium efflux system outer membrane protein